MHSPIGQLEYTKKLVNLWFYFVICRIGGEVVPLREEAGDMVSKYQEGLGTADYMDQVHFFGEVKIVDPTSHGMPY